MVSDGDTVVILHIPRYIHTRTWYHHGTR